MKREIHSVGGSGAVYLSLVDSRTIRAAAWLKSSSFCLGLCTVRTCSAKALLMEGWVPLGKGMLQMEQLFIPASSTR